MRALEARLRQEVYFLLYIHLHCWMFCCQMYMYLFFFQNLPGAECTMANRTEVPQSGARQKVEFGGGGERAQRNH